MNSEWKEYKLGDVINFDPRESVQKGVFSKKIAMEKLQPYSRKISGYELTEFKGGSKFRNGDTLLARITPCLENGKTAQVSILDNNEIGFGSTEFIVLRERKKITDNNFIYYLSISPDFRNTAIKSMSGTSGRQRAQRDVLENYLINLPPLPEQKRIAEILSSLDDKIELNNKMNKNLEEMAQAIFKQWFVDFEFPDENGNPYKSSGGKMIQSELGEIPEGWSVKELGECYNLIMGQSPPGISYNEEGEGIVFYQGRTDFGFRFPTNRLFTTSPTRFAQKLDTLVSVRAPVGDINMANEECCIGRGLSSIRHKTDSYSFTFYSMKNIANDFLKFESEGTVFGSINKNSFNKIKIIEPTKSIIENFDRIVNGLDDKLFKNTIEIQSLTKTRDQLLPKLMSGEITV